MGERWSLRLRFFLFFALIAIGGAVAIAGALILGFARLGQPEAASAFILSCALAIFGLTGLVAWVWLRFDENVARPIGALSSELRARAHAEITGEIDRRPARYLGDLAPSAAAVSAVLRETRDELEAVVMRETARITADKARLETILRDLAEGVILCTSGHEVVLYNRQAAYLLRDVGELGLKRPLFDLLRSGPVLYAYERLMQAPPGGLARNLICTTPDATRMLHGRMRLVETPGSGLDAPGYVLTLQDVTEDLAAHAGREHLMREFIEHIRRPAANLQTTLDVLEMDPQPEPDTRARLQAAVVSETGALVEGITDIARRNEIAASRWWPMAEIPARDLLDSLVARLAAEGLEAVAEAEALTIRCDGFALVQLFGGLAGPLAAASAPKRLSIAIRRDGSGAMIEASWDGPVLPVEAVEDWLSRPLSGGYGEYTGRDALDSHGADIWPERLPGNRACLRLPLREAWPETVDTSLPLRPEFYDFDLFSSSSRGLSDTRELETLTYVVFDTETTGLDPAAGDELVQVAAVRIVNGRMLSGEKFDSLVNPGRRIPEASTRVHGITDAMVADAPEISETLSRFHRFCGGAVLIAHNAPFDLAFLRRHEEAIGCRFDHPVLDTVLISAILYGETAAHDLDSVAGRLDISIDEAVRHTALGDSLATADAFLKMLPMLRAAGISSLAQLTQRFQQFRRIKRKQDQISG
jgi:DNA polymerase-3 subunit epsilon